MKLLLILLFSSLISTNGMAQFNFTFPDKWTRDFSAEVTDKGGMLDHEMTIRLTYDSCIYKSRIQAKHEKNSFKMDDSKRKEIFQQLKRLKSDPKGSVVITLDKGTSSIVLRNGDGIFATSDDTDDDEIRRDFHEVLNYLVEVARLKGKTTNR